MTVSTHNCATQFEGFVKKLPCLQKGEKLVRNFCICIYQTRPASFQQPWAAGIRDWAAETSAVSFLFVHTSAPVPGSANCAPGCCISYHQPHSTWHAGWHIQVLSQVLVPPLAKQYDILKHEWVRQELWRHDDFVEMLHAQQPADASIKAAEEAQTMTGAGEAAVEQYLEM